MGNTDNSAHKYKGQREHRCQGNEPIHYRQSVVKVFVCNFANPTPVDFPIVIAASGQGFCARLSDRGRSAGTAEGEGSGAHKWKGAMKAIDRRLRRLEACLEPPDDPEGRRRADSLRDLIRRRCEKAGHPYVDLSPEFEGLSPD